MDSTEDVSARLLLRNILYTEPPRSPVTRSWSRVAQGDVETEGPPSGGEAQGSVLRRSPRKSLRGTSQTPDVHLNKLHKVSQRDVETQRPQGRVEVQGSNVRRSVRSRRSHTGTSQTPQEALKTQLKRKLHESASRSSLAPKSKPLSDLRWPRPMTSLIYDDDITPRRLLQNIIHTEAVVSPVLHVRSEGDGVAPDQTAEVSAASSIASIELDLPDVTMANIAGTVKRLRRTRPRPSFNVTAFEKHLEPDQDAELQAEESGHELSSLSTSMGSATLSLKTPAVDISTLKGGLRRKTQRRTKFSADDFIAGVQQRQLAGGHAEDEDGVHLALHGTSSTECVTLGLSDLPDITADIIHQRTTLYAGASGASIDNTCQPPEGDEQRAGEVEDHPSAEDHPSSKDHPSSEDHPPTVDHPSSEDQPSTEEEEEQGNPVAMETQSEEEVPGSQRSSGQPGVESSSSRARSEGHLLREHHSEGFLFADGQRGRGYMSVGAMDLRKLEEEKKDSPPSVGPTINDESIRSAADQLKVGEVQSEEEEMQDVAQEEEGLQSGRGEQQEEEEMQGVEEGVQSGEEEQEEEEEEEEEEGMQSGQEEEEEEKAQSGQEEEKAQSGQEEEEAQSGQEEEAQSEEEVQGVEEEEGMQSGQEEEEAQSGQEEEEAQSGQEEEEAQSEEEFQEGPQDLEELEAELSKELSMKTPAFVRQKNFVSGGGSVAAQQSLQGAREAPAPPRKARAKRVRAAGGQARLPKSYLMSTFKHFAQTRVATDVYPVLDNIVDAFFQRMAVDLETYAHHAKRKTIEVADVELLLRRQGYVNDKVPVTVLIEKYLPMEYRKMLIPVATSGNVVIPKQK